MRTGGACVSPTWGGGVSVGGLGGRPVSRGEKVSTTVSLEGCELLRCGGEGGLGSRGSKGGLGRRGGRLCSRGECGIAEGLALTAPVG